MTERTIKLSDCPLHEYWSFQHNLPLWTQMNTTTWTARRSGSFWLSSSSQSKADNLNGQHINCTLFTFFAPAVTTALYSISSFVFLIMSKTWMENGCICETSHHKMISNIRRMESMPIWFVKIVSISNSIELCWLRGLVDGSNDYINWYFSTFMSLVRHKFEFFGKYFLRAK